MDFYIPMVSSVYTKEDIENIFTDCIGIVNRIDLIKDDDNFNYNTVFVYCNKLYENYMNKNIMNHFSNNKPFVLHLGNIFGIRHADDKWLLQKI
jgi:hypothetical protein